MPVFKKCKQSKDSRFFKKFVVLLINYMIFMSLLSSLNNSVTGYSLFSDVNTQIKGKINKTRKRVKMFVRTVII